MIPQHMVAMMTQIHPIQSLGYYSSNNYSFLFVQQAHKFPPHSSFPQFCLLLVSSLQTLKLQTIIAFLTFFRSSNFVIVVFA